jgi:hypothetical protein
MRIFNLQIPRTGSNNEWAGVYLFLLKELAVQAGYEVLASGDGSSLYAWKGYTQPTPSPGSGGGFDCWIDGSIRNPNTPAIAGDATNASAWCILSDPSGRMILLQQTNQTSGYSGYCRIAVTHGGPLGGWAPDINTGPSTIPPVPPGGAPQEAWLFGARNSGAGADVFLYNVSGAVHLWADTTPGVDGGLPLGWVSANSLGTVVSMCSIAPLVDAVDPDDHDPCMYIHGSAALAGTVLGDELQGYATAQLGPNLTQWTSATAADSSGLVPLFSTPAIYIPAYSRRVKGMPHPTSIHRVNIVAPWGYRGDDQYGDHWATMANRMAFPWDPAAGDPLPAVAPGTYDFRKLTLFSLERAVAVPVGRHTNRVWDTAANAFVRWVTPDPDPQGQQYPGPGAFGVDTINYCLESVT